MNINQVMDFDRKYKLQLTTSNKKMNINQLMDFDRKTNYD